MRLLTVESGVPPDVLSRRSEAKAEEAGVPPPGSDARTFEDI